MKQKITVFIHCCKYDWKEEGVFVAHPYRFDDSTTHIFLFEQEIEIDIPDDFDPTPIQIEKLRKEKQRILAEAQVKANNIDQQIQEMLCIENKGDAVE